MIKLNNYNINIIAFIVFSALMPVNFLYADEVTQVVGSVSINALDNETAVKLAKLEAKRRAVSQAFNSDLNIKEKMLATDFAMSNVGGAITQVKWGRSQVKNGKVSISLTATVSKEILQTGQMTVENTLRMNGLPRIGVIINSVIVDTDGKVLTNVKPFSFFKDIVKSGIKSYFMKITPDMDIKYLNHDSTIDGQILGMLFNSSANDSGARSNALLNELEVSASSENEVNDAQALTRELGVDLIMVGKVNIVVNKREVSGAKVISLTVLPQIEIVNAANNKTIALVEDSYETKKILIRNYQNSISKSLKRIGITTGQELMGNLVKQWSDNRIDIDIVLKNADYNSVCEVKSILKEPGDNQQFVLRSLRSNTAHIEFYTELPKDAVCEILQSQNTTNLMIESITESGIVINMGN